MRVLKWYVPETEAFSSALEVFHMLSRVHSSSSIVFGCAMVCSGERRM